MIPLNLPITDNLSLKLVNYQPEATTSCIGGLLTIPRLHANTIRIEFLVHLAVHNCQGKRKPGHKEIRRWLNRNLTSPLITDLEDPPEDAFLSNVCTPEGNRRIFEGIWESNNYFLQTVLDTLLTTNSPRIFQELLRSIFDLLRLSDAVAERVKLERWHIEPSNPKGKIPNEFICDIEKNARAITFTRKEIYELEIDLQNLRPFILRDVDRQQLLLESLGHTSLERRPLVEFDDTLVLSLPSAVSPAIRRYVLEELQKVKMLTGFTDVLSKRQANQLENDGLRELRGKVHSLTPPNHTGENMPSLHTWLLKYDSDKYLHIVLLHDLLNQVVSEGFASFQKYKDAERKELKEYFAEVAAKCKSLPDCNQGMTIILIGGLGRGFMLNFEDWPENWWFSVLRLPELLTLAGEPNYPINRFIKFVKQREWAEQQGVTFINVNGDLNQYCFWCDNKHQIVPHDLPISKASHIAIQNDYVLKIRQDVHHLVDPHVIQTASGEYARAVRLTHESYFDSLKERPIYVINLAIQ